MNRHEFYDKLKEYNSLQHYGTLGQKWGVRKWQNYDGTFNEAGKERYFGKSSKNSSSDEKVGSLPQYLIDQRNKEFEIRKEKNKILEDGEEYLHYDLDSCINPNKELDKIYKKINPYDTENSVDPEIRDMLALESKDIYNKFYKSNDPQKALDDLSKEHGYDKEIIKNIIAYQNSFEAQRDDMLPEDFGINEDDYYNMSDEDKDKAIREFYSWAITGKSSKNNSENDKIGGLFNKTPEEKEFKEAKKLVQQLNFNNGTRVLKELNNTEYGKKHIQPIYDKYEENMNKLADKAEKIIKDNPVDEIEAGIASAIDHNHDGRVPNIGYIINSVRRQHHASTVDSFINTDSLPLLKSEEDLYTEAKEYKKEFGENIEKAIKDINPKANITLSSLAALTNYENDKLEKVYNMNGENYRRYQLYQTINYGLVPETNKEIIRKNIVEPTKKLYPKVEKLFKNTNVGDPTYDWSDIGKALVKLGLDDKGADELTNADWKKVYEICSQ